MGLEIGRRSVCLSAGGEVGERRSQHRECGREATPTLAISPLSAARTPQAAQHVVSSRRRPTGLSEGGTSPTPSSFAGGGVSWPGAVPCGTHASGPDPQRVVLPGCLRQASKLRCGESAGSGENGQLVSREVSGWSPGEGRSRVSPHAVVRAGCESENDRSRVDLNESSSRWGSLWPLSSHMRRAGTTGASIARPPRPPAPPPRQVFPGGREPATSAPTPSSNHVPLGRVLCPHFQALGQPAREFTAVMGQQGCNPGPLLYQLMAWHVPQAHSLTTVFWSPW